MAVKRILTFKEACEALRCGRTKLYGLIKDGRIVATKIGGETCILEDSINKYIDRQTLKVS